MDGLKPVPFKATKSKSRSFDSLLLRKARGPFAQDDSLLNVVVSQVRKSGPRAPIFFGESAGFERGFAAWIDF